MITTAWIWLTQNRWAQYLGGALLAFIGWKAWLATRDRQIRDEEKARFEHEILKEEVQLRKTIDEAENDVTRDLNARSLHELATNHPGNRRAVRQD